jgi:hypothetical protein
LAGARCFGPLFTAASTARSKRDHASGSISISGSVFLRGFAMSNPYETDFAHAIAVFHEHAALVGKIAILWNELHERYGIAFGKIVNPGNFEMGLNIWQAVWNDRAKRSMLLAAINTLDTKVHGRFVTEMTWAINKTDSLEDNRDTAVHAPYITSHNEGRFRIISSDGLRHRRAEKLSGKDVKLELESYEANLRAIMEFIGGLGVHFDWPEAKFAWPERPSMPRPAHPNRDQGRTTNK